MTAHTECVTPSPGHAIPGHAIPRSRMASPGGRSRQSRMAFFALCTYTLHPHAAKGARAPALTPHLRPSRACVREREREREREKERKRERELAAAPHPAPPPPHSPAQARRMAQGEHDPAGARAHAGVLLWRRRGVGACGCGRRIVGVPKPKSLNPNPESSPEPRAPNPETRWAAKWAYRGRRPGRSPPCLSFRARTAGCSPSVWGFGGFGV